MKDLSTYIEESLNEAIDKNNLPVIGRNYQGLEDGQIYIVCGYISVDGKVKKCDKKYICKDLNDVLDHWDNSGEMNSELTDLPHDGVIVWGIMPKYNERVAILWDNVISQKSILPVVGDVVESENSDEMRVVDYCSMDNQYHGISSNVNTLLRKWDYSGVMKEAIASNEVSEDDILVACMMGGRETAVFIWSQLVIKKLKQ